ncbi:MAG: ATP phosphoribosyltransferase regulatory subunit [Granulosicoccus sp.]
MNEPRTDRWQLPDGVDELLPDAAWRVEHLRRSIMDCCYRWGFELITPPLIEYVDSLLTGTGETMDLQTFKLVDQQNGRTLGVRADMTPQAARIDAHALKRDAPNRLFYTGTVLRARADGHGGSRSPQQFGAELFGHSGPESDIEIIQLMLETVKLAGIGTDQLVLDLGHVGVYHALKGELALSPELEAQLFAAMQRGSVPDAQSLLSEMSQYKDTVQRILALMALRGDASTIDAASDALAGSPAGVQTALDNLRHVVSTVRATHPNLELHIDLSELRGYRYHTGMLFAVHDINGDELARGGRYDDIGAAFGHARPATGFSGELKRLADRIDTEKAVHDRGIFAALSDRADQQQAISDLRSAGERVVCALPAATMDARSAACTRELVFVNGDWIVRAIG